MKKVLFLQIKGNTYGGVWQVNKLVGEELLKNNYQVHIISIRNNQEDIKLEYNKDLVVKTINEKDIWESYHLNDVLDELKKFKFINSFKMIISKLKYNKGLKKDIKKLQDYIKELDPDYIVTSHYQLLDMIPNEYLNKTINEHHTSFEDMIKHRATRKTLKKYNGKIKYLWLTKETMNYAIKFGLKESYYIYNAVKFKSDKISDVIKNKKLITIARFSNQKRIDLMIDIVEEIFKDKKFQDWKLEIYGTGEEENKIKEHIHNNKQIKIMGITNNPKKELLTSSINLNTSSFEGFCLSILEAQECGVPTITLNFGESVFEEIIDNKTGIIALNKEDYINKLKELMQDTDKLLYLSKNAKDYSEKFQIENIVNDWINLFNKID